ncbi:uncharacterized protein CHSO_1379 [Chryseobacterium sp. StRB126]|nr:uncharacterized protein CHSO_1379 [Chryseobacterium sp. StRB126]
MYGLIIVALLKSNPHKIFTMITIIPEAPENVAAFSATGEVTKEDFEKLVIPRVKEKVDEFGELNYLLYLDTDLDKFTMGAWLEDLLLGLKNLAKWNRTAIVTDKKAVQNFTDIFSVLMPGEFKSFPKENLYNALYWCKNGNEVEV